MKILPEWLRLHEAIALLAYGCTEEHLDEWAYPGASVGLKFVESCYMHDAWRGNGELPTWLRAALVRSGKLRGSWKSGARPLSSLLHSLQREIQRYEAQREDEDGKAEKVFATLTEARGLLFEALEKGRLTSYGQPGEKAAAAAAIPAEVYGAPIRLTPEGHIRCALAASELILWRDVVVRRVDFDRQWPDDDATLIDTKTAAAAATAEPIKVGEPRCKERADRGIEPDAKAIAVMTSIQTEAIEQHGRPLDIRSLGRELKARSGISARTADRLAQALPGHLRNLPRR